MPIQQSYRPDLSLTRTLIDMAKEQLWDYVRDQRPARAPQWKEWENVQIAQQGYELFDVTANPVGSVDNYVDPAAQPQQPTPVSLSWATVERYAVLRNGQRVGSFDVGILHVQPIRLNIYAALTYPATLSAADKTTLQNAFRAWDGRQDPVAYAAGLDVKIPFDVVCTYALEPVGGVKTNTDQRDYLVGQYNGDAMQGGSIYTGADEATKRQDIKDYFHAQKLRAVLEAS